MRAPNLEVPMRASTFVDEATREALRRACARLDHAELSPGPHAMCQALADLGRCYLRLKATACAETCFIQALSWSRLAGANDLVMEMLCELGEVAARLAHEQDADEPGSGHAARERARDLAFEASQLAGTLADASCETSWLLQVGEVLLLCGDHEEAQLVQMRAIDRLDPRFEARRTDARHLLTAPGRFADH
jgi:tetratricopeptide (TPR) repeat protein